jgi:ribosomal protein S18 acetylase RimI-like enzyme
LARPSIILPLDINRTRRYLEALCQIDREAFGKESWARKNFEHPLPSKFELSRVALFEERPVGYLIAATYGGEYVHIYRLVVSSALRRKGIGAGLLRSFEHACLEIGRHLGVTLESLRSRGDANHFYEQMGFKTISGEQLLDYLRRRERLNIKQEYHEISSQGESLVYFKPITRARS